MKTLATLEDFDTLIEKTSKLESEVDRINLLCDYHLASEAIDPEMFSRDPFSLQYKRACLELLLKVSGRSGYSPGQNEKSDFLDEFAGGIYVPSIYRYKESRFLGDIYSAAGSILKAMDVRAGDSILEYGAGDGQLALSLARMGCRVSVVDIEERYLKIIERQAAAFGVDLQLVKGAFGDDVGKTGFDRILFYEAFHHAFEHQELIHKLKGLVLRSGRVVLAGEPIFARSSHWRAAVPFSWGPRLDGLSIRSMRAHGWCELGFQREYLVEAFMRSGWLISYSPGTGSDRGQVYTATLSDNEINCGLPLIFETTKFDDGWHEGEGGHRWTAGNASIALDQTRCSKGVDIVLINFLPVVRHGRLIAGDSTRPFSVAPGETTNLTLSLPRDYDVLQICCDPVRISDVVPGSSDPRCVGIAVSTISYR